MGNKGTLCQKYQYHMDLLSAVIRKYYKNWFQPSFHSFIQSPWQLNDFASSLYCKHLIYRATTIPSIVTVPCDGDIRCVGLYLVKFQFIPCYNTAYICSGYSWIELIISSAVTRHSCIDNNPCIIVTLCCVKRKNVYGRLFDRKS